MNDAMARVQALAEADESKQVSEKYDQKAEYISQAVISVTNPELSQQQLQAARKRINDLRKMMPTLEFLKMQLQSETKKNFADQAKQSEIKVRQAF